MDAKTAIVEIRNYVKLREDRFQPYKEIIFDEGGEMLDALLEAATQLTIAYEDLYKAYDQLRWLNQVSQINSHII